jgi:hypothetical protein
MAHFAEIGLNNVVQQVIVVNNNELLDENGIEQESLGQEFCRKLLGGTWIQTSYSGQFRKNYAGPGFVYDSVKDAFIAPKPYASWTLDENTLQWAAPVPVPDTNNVYAWDEPTQSWTLVPLQG